MPRRAGPSALALVAALIGLVATAVAGGPADRARAAPAAELLYFDDFSDPASGWIVYVLEHSTGYYADGAYHADVVVPDLVTYGTYMSGRFDDFDARYRIRAERAATAGATWVSAIFRFQRQPAATFYTFDVSPDGQWYRLLRWDQREYVTIQDVTAASVINPGLMENELRVVARGAEISLYINGAHMADLYDGALTSGTIGLGAGNIGNPGGMQAGLDSVAVYGLGGGTAVPSPTSRPVRTAVTPTLIPGQATWTPTVTPTATLRPSCSPCGRILLPYGAGEG